MLEFFRRYQKIFFIAITVVIVISFSFFGTYSSFAGGEKKDSVAFIAVDGSKVYRSELNNLIHLLASDSRDVQSRVGGNPFNDEFISKDILETGIAEVIEVPYLPKMKSELTSRLEKEKRFVPYSNPSANFISAEQVWAYFAPDIKKAFDQLRMQTDAASSEAMTARIQLFLAERRFPSLYLKQLIRYQEKQYEWLKPDHELTYKDLSLFGYHSIQDWFGKDFLELIAKYVINTAKIAEGKGYQVSNDEVLNSLVANVKASYNESKRDAYFKGDTLNGYFQEELRRLGMDQSRLIQAWRNVVLFRRFFHENQDSILVSPLPFSDFYRHLNEYVDVELYTLPKELQFQNMRDVEKFEIYANAIRDPKELKGKGANALLPPEKILAVNELKNIFPELVQKYYRLKYGSVNKEHLQAKVGVKKTWEWEVQDKNWKVLQTKFPELGAIKGGSADERLTALDRLDQKARVLIDEYSRKCIVDEHPEWLAAALDAAVLNEEEEKLHEQGGTFPFTGVKNRADFMRVLDKAPLNASHPPLQAYTQDGVHYYRIVVLERADAPEIVTFAQASSDGTLDQLLDKVLDAAYVRVRSQKPAQFLQENGEWKPLAEVKEQIANSHFDDLLRQLDREREHEQSRSPQLCNFESKDKARIACRLSAHVRKMWQKIKDKPEKVASYLRDPKSKQNNSIVDQWRLERSKERVVRREPNQPIEITEAFVLAPTAFSELRYNDKSGLSFYKVIEKGILPYEDAVHEKVVEARELLGREVERALALVLLKS
ncbi:MAG: hypothetical protein JWO53_345, partial [Chlamydiia bacterium]|nr:hypothetical protein [Chlamydiia bacterium]